MLCAKDDTDNYTMRGDMLLSIKYYPSGGEYKYNSKSFNEDTLNTTITKCTYRFIPKIV